MLCLLVSVAFSIQSHGEKRQKKKTQQYNQRRTHWNTAHTYTETLTTACSQEEMRLLRVKTVQGEPSPKKKKKNEKTTFVFVARQLEGETERGGEERETTGCSGWVWSRWEQRGFDGGGGEDEGSAGSSFSLSDAL